MSNTVNNSLAPFLAALAADPTKTIQKITYPCGCEQIGIAPLPKECPTHGIVVQTGKIIKVAVILDESGSMTSVRQKTIDGYNEYLNGLQKDGKPYQITLSKFDSFMHEPTCRILYQDKPVGEAPKLTEASYSPRGNTPMYDAIGETVSAINSDDSSAVLVLIMTDGEENCSKTWNSEKVKTLIKEKEALGNWTFVYLGANQDAWEAGQKFGMQQGNVMTFATGSVHNVMSNLVRSTSMYSKNVDNGVLNSCNYFADAGLSADNININYTTSTAAQTLGSLGGTARAKNQTPEERRKLAMKGVKARAMYKKQEETTNK